ncbi:MAG: hypothetical protein Q8942_04520 [Bacillota bacterium]|nr:hypothetical protein [Bacillota bacterium]
MKTIKIIKRIYKWIILSILIQVLVLAYLNFNYLLKEHDIKATSYDIKENAPIKEDSSMKIPSEASSLSVSFDGNYAAYLLEGKVCLYDLKNKEEKTSVTDSNGDINYFKWLPDRNIIIYSVNSFGKNSETEKILISTKDIETDNNHSYPVISGLSKSSEVTDIELSPLTNMVYVKIKTSSSKSRIYKFDIMYQSNFVINVGNSATIKEANLSDKLFYEDSENRIQIWDGKRSSRTRLSYKNKVALIGLDSEDTVYFGETNSDGKLTKILYGKYDNTDHSENKWEEIQLKSSYDKKDIVITENGNIYSIDTEKNVATNLKNNSEVKYEGEFIGISDNYIAYSKDNKLKVNPL